MSRLRSGGAALFAGGVLVAGILGCAALESKAVVKLDQVDVVSLPNWIVDGIVVNDSCSTLFDACLRTSCTVRSQDDEPTSGVVTFRLDQAGKVSTPLDVALGPRESRQVSADFKEAKLLGGQATGTCDVQKTGTRVRCTVSNTGKVEHAVNVIGRLTDKQGAKAAEKRQQVALAAGESRELTYVFDKLAEVGTCTIE